VKDPLTLLAEEQTLRILDEDTEVARHARSYDRGKVIEVPVHIAELAREKRRAHDLRGRDLLRSACKHADALLDALALRGENLGGHTARLTQLLDRYGAAELDRAIAEALERGAPGAALRRAHPQPACSRTQGVAVSSSPLPTEATANPLAPQRAKHWGLAMTAHRHGVPVSATLPTSPTPQELVALPEFALLAALQQLLELTTQTLAAIHPIDDVLRSRLRPHDLRAALADQIVELGACLTRATTCYRSLSPIRSTPRHRRHSFLSKARRRRRAGCVRAHESSPGLALQAAWPGLVVYLAGISPHPMREFPRHQAATSSRLDFQA
jgi:hypothetical protein